ncbi:MAG: hypothetical protein K5925_03885 [Bacilli bacterium]|nr:hypothetical protein [Bacilli bacterium]
MKKVLLFVTMPLIISCGNNQPTPTPVPAKEYFALWNDGDVLKTLKSYVADVTNKYSTNYIPVEDRIATFDMDGTFIGELYPTYFEYNMLEYRGLDDSTYTDKDPFVVETAQDIRDFVRTGKALPKYNEEYGFDIKHALVVGEYVETTPGDGRYHFNCTSCGFGWTKNNKLTSCSRL